MSSHPPWKTPPWNSALLSGGAACGRGGGIVGAGGTGCWMDGQAQGCKGLDRVGLGCCCAHLTLEVEPAILPEGSGADAGARGRGDRQEDWLGAAFPASVPARLCGYSHCPGALRQPRCGCCSARVARTAHTPAHAVLLGPCRASGERECMERHLKCGTRWEAHAPAPWLLSADSSRICTDSGAALGL